jgi:hypothetical protein
MASFALALKPRLRPESGDTPRIAVRQEIVPEKKGVLFSGFAWHEWLEQKARGNENLPSILHDHD